MILPIVAYGDPVLKKVTDDIKPGHPGLQELIDNMYETMYNAHGVGLAAPQVGESIRLFIIDSRETEDDHSKGRQKGLKQVFINATMLKELGQPWTYEEGCLSIPGVREGVSRKPEIEIEYLDEHMEYHRSTFTGLTARIIQHEYDHVDGVLFTDHLKPLKKRLIRRRLNAITKGDIEVPYKMKYPTAVR